MIAKSSTGRPCLRSSKNSFMMNVSDKRGNRLTRMTIRSRVTAILLPS
jgi:hypothetical protein